MIGFRNVVKGKQDAETFEAAYALFRKCSDLFPALAVRLAVAEAYPSRLLGIYIIFKAAVCQDRTLIVPKRSSTSSEGLVWTANNQNFQDFE